MSRSYAVNVAPPPHKFAWAIMVQTMAEN